MYNRFDCSLLLEIKKARAWLVNFHVRLDISNQTEISQIELNTFPSKLGAFEIKHNIFQIKAGFFHIKYENFFAQRKFL